MEAMEASNLNETVKSVLARLGVSCEIVSLSSIRSRGVLHGRMLWLGFDHKIDERLLLIRISAVSEVPKSRTQDVAELVLRISLIARPGSCQFDLDSGDVWWQYCMITDAVNETVLGATLNRLIYLANVFHPAFRMVIDHGVAPDVAWRKCLTAEESTPRTESESSVDSTHRDGSGSIHTKEKVYPGSMGHDVAPAEASLGSANQEFVRRILESPYCRRVQEQAQKVVGQEIESSIAGRAGFVLLTVNDFAIINYLDNDRLELKICEGRPSTDDMRLINSPEAGDGASPLTQSFPYGNEHNNMVKEIANTHGKTITGLSMGETSFNFCFPEDRELETFVVEDAEGKTALRVHWEQW